MSEPRCNAPLSDLLRCELATDHEGKHAASQWQWWYVDDRIEVEDRDPRARGTDAG